MYFKFLYVFLILCSGLLAQKQEFEAGGGGGLEYNFQTKSFGIQAKYVFRLGRFALSPSYSYSPTTVIDSSIYVNNVQERHFTLSLQFDLSPRKPFTVYPFLGMTYNQWLDHDESVLFGVEKVNIFPRGGFGISSRYGCFRPYGELSYNYFWKEGLFRAGVLWYPFHCNKRSKGNCPTF